MSSSNTAPKGGFLQGIPQVSTLPVRSLATGDCCGSTGHASNTGCCGEAAAQIPLTASTQTSQGCCGEPTGASMTATQANGCCGEPVSAAVERSGTSQAGCCN